MDCDKKEKIGEICSNFAKKNNINENKVIFKYNNDITDKKQTLEEFLNDNLID